MYLSYAVNYDALGHNAKDAHNFLQKAVDLKVLAKPAHFKDDLYQLVV